jgi:hypothetical protein
LGKLYIYLTKCGIENSYSNSFLSNTLDKFNVLSLLIL